MSTTELSYRMRARADADGLPANHELRTTADAFDNAAMGYLAHPQTVPVRQFFGNYARARLAWCAYSGESVL